MELKHLQVMGKVVSIYSTHIILINRFKKRSESLTDRRAASISSGPVYHHLLIISFLMILYLFIFLIYLMKMS